MSADTVPVPGTQNCRYNPSCNKLYWFSFCTASINSPSNPTVMQRHVSNHQGFWLLYKAKATAFLCWRINWIDQGVICWFWCMPASLSVVKLLLGLEIILAQGIKRQEIKLTNPLCPHLLKNYFILTVIFGTMIIIISNHITFLCL